MRGNSSSNNIKIHVFPMANLSGFREERGVFILLTMASFYLKIKTDKYSMQPNDTLESLALDTFSYSKSIGTKWNENMF